MKKLIAWSFCFVLGGSVMAQGGNGAPEKKATAASPAGAPALQLALQFADDSRITGTPAIDGLKMTTQYANVEIPFSRIRTILFAATNRTVQVSLKNGDRLSGQVAAMSITLKTSAGQVMVPLAQVRQIRVGPIGGTMPEGLVLNYGFDANEGEKVTDSSGAGNHGKVHGAVYTNEGRIFGAMSFSGDGDAIIVGNPEGLRLNDFTIMAWIKRGDTGKVSNTTPYGEIFGYGRGGFVFGIHQDGNVYLSKADFDNAASSFQIHDKDFHHVAVTKQGNKLVFYLDGIAYPAQDYNPGFEFTTDAAVGARSDDLHKCFIGLIDELAVFKRPLSADEVKAVYESQK